jgi:hypothetical protein
MKSKIGIFAALCVMPLLAASLPSLAQATTAPDEAQKAPAKAAKAAKKVEPPKTNATVKKKYVAQKKPPASKAAPAKSPPTSANPNVTVLKSGQRSPVTLRDKDGNVIPTSPDAYDVSSATGKK